MIAQGPRMSDTMTAFDIGTVEDSRSSRLNFQDCLLPLHCAKRTRYHDSSAECLRVRTTPTNPASCKVQHSQDTSASDVQIRYLRLMLVLCHHRTSSAVSANPPVECFATKKTDFVAEII